MKITKAVCEQSGKDLWAITCYFNPARYRRKLANYRVFRERLRLPLIAVELAYGADFELNALDADILLQLHGRDVMWQKERLLNVALPVLPRSCRKVVWTDCDVVFESDDWCERTSELLDRFALVQPFSRVHRMPPGWQPGDDPLPGMETRRSVPFLLASGMSMTACLGVTGEQIACSTGYAWAAHRATLQRHRFYDACVIGSADSAMCRAAYGHFDHAMRLHHMTEQQKPHYLAWAEPFHDAISASVAFVEGNLFHLWHGKTEDRGYSVRRQILKHFQFDPSEDIALEGNGAWRWSSDKHEMHDRVRDYFAARREDG